MPFWLDVLTAAVISFSDKRWVGFTLLLKMM